MLVLMIFRFWRDTLQSFQASSVTFTSHPADGVCKILYTVLRELLQNADDAKANRVLIRFETKSFKPIIPTSLTGDGHPNLQDHVR